MKGNEKALIIAKSVIMKAFHIFSFFTLTMCALTAQVLPTDLQFSRLAVRRFVFDNNINLCEFLPSKIVAFNGMYPVLGVSENGKPNYVKRDFKDPSGRDFVFENYGDKLCAIGIGGVFPFACYETQINGIKSENGNRFSTGIVIGDNTLRNSVRFFCEKSGQNTSIVFDEFSDGKKTQSRQILKNAPLPPFKLIVQLYGNCAAVFTEKDGKTSYVWHMQKGDFFGKNCDFRIRKTAAKGIFGIFSEGFGSAKIGAAKQYISAGIGQADLRAVKYSDLSPYMENGRLYFTFSARGLYTAQSVQGVLSFNPSVFDIKFEGLILFDHGDGLLRNDYASHLFFDKNSNKWRAISCDFGGTKNRDDRTYTGLLFAESDKNPLRGISVMNAYRAEPENIPGHNEDPSLYYDNNAKKYRLLTSKFVENNIVCALYESDKWDGDFTEIARLKDTNSTGTSICEIGGKPYCLMGGNGLSNNSEQKYSQNLRVHSYPDLKYLGDLNLNFPPHAPKPPKRIWADIVTLPEGYPYKYVLLTMDRANFPNVKGANWSYGALYLFGALLP